MPFAMPDNTDILDKMLKVSDALEKKGIRHVLVGGVALLALGSLRFTKDVDFLVSPKDFPADDLVEVFYKHGFELVTKFNARHEVLRTVDNPRIAALKLKSDLPDSIFFFDWDTRLKIDLLLDFPVSAQEVIGRSSKIKIKSRSIRIASPEDLLRMKELAYADRHSAADAQDLEFLKRLLK